jgi:hypothetical protein
MASIISDGWTSTAPKPFVIIIDSSPKGSNSHVHSSHRLLKKNAEFIAKVLMEAIEEIEPHWWHKLS